MHHPEDVITKLVDLLGGEILRRLRLRPLLVVSVALILGVLTEPLTLLNICEAPVLRVLRRHDAVSGFVLNIHWELSRKSRTSLLVVRGFRIHVAEIDVELPALGHVIHLVRVLHLVAVPLGLETGVPLEVLRCPLLVELGSANL